MNKKLGKSLNKFYSKKVNVQETLYGELGIPVNGVKRVDVPGRPGYVYVRLRGNNSELVQAYNSAVPTKYDYPVIVLRKKNTYTILGRDQGKYSNMGNIGQTIGFTPLPNHGGQHSFNPSLGMGADPVWVFSQQFMPQLIYPSGSSMLLAVNPHFYEWEGQWKYPQTTTPSFAPYVPTATGSARMALLFIDGDTGALNIVGGVGFSGGINNAADLAQFIPDIDRNNSIPLAAVKLGTGTTSIGWEDIYDMRDFYTVSKYFHGIGIQDNGTPMGTGHILNFGNNLSVSFAGNTATIDATAGGGGGGGIGVMGWDEGIPLGTGSVLNFVGENIDASISGTVIRVFVTGSASAPNPPITGSIVFWDEGILKGSATILNVVSDIADLAISGSVARLFITGSASAALGTGTATYLRVGQPTPLLSTTGTYWKTPEPYATGSLAVFNQGHALIIGIDYSEQYAVSGTYQYTEAQSTGTYHLSVYGVPATVAGSISTGTSGGRTLISEALPSGTASVTFSSIPSTYKKLIIEYSIRSTQAANNVSGLLQMNGDTTSGNYRYALWRNNNFGTANDVGSDYIFAFTSIPAASAQASGFAIGSIELPQYANTNFYKDALVRFGTWDNGAYQSIVGNVFWMSTSAINQLVVALSAGNFVYGSVLRLYGEN